MVIADKHQAWKMIKKDYPDMKDFILELKKHFPDLGFRELEIFNA